MLIFDHIAKGFPDGYLMSWIVALVHGKPVPNLGVYSDHRRSGLTTFTDALQLLAPVIVVEDLDLNGLKLPNRPIVQTGTNISYFLLTDDWTLGEVGPLESPIEMNFEADANRQYLLGLPVTEVTAIETELKQSTIRVTKWLEAGN